MAGRRPNKMSMEEVLHILFEEDPDDPVSAADSSSDDEDFLQDLDSDSDYKPPLERYNSVHYLLERHLKERFIYTSM